MSALRKVPNTPSAVDRKETFPMKACRISKSSRKIVPAVITACVPLLVGLVFASSASADFGIASFDGSVNDQNGEPFTQAGGYPFAASTGFTLDSEVVRGNLRPKEDVKDVQVELPVGFVGNPTSMPQCSQADFYDSSNCPADTQIGISDAFFVAFGTTQGGPYRLYNLKPQGGFPAEFGFRVATSYIRIRATVGPAPDRHLILDVPDISQGVSLITNKVTVWGSPADSAHDGERGDCLSEQVGPTGQLCPSDAPKRPFLRMPTSCLGPQTTTMRADSWQDPGDFKTASFVSHDNQGNPVGVTRCDRLDFSPTINVESDSDQAASPAGLNVDIHVPQPDDLDRLAEADLRSAVVKLPEGMAVNPAAADGLAGCAPDQIGLNDSSEPSCPDASKIGTVTVDSPLLDDTLTGAVYLAKPHDNPFDSLLAIYVTAEADGVLIKLAGHVVPDPVTGQLTATFDNNPQLPFTDFKLRFFGGSRATLVNPQTCGTFAARSELTPWSSLSPVVSESAFAVDQGCDLAARFEPTLDAGTTEPAAGGSSAFTLTLSRPDGQQNVSGLDVSLPPGLLGKIADVPLCGESDAAAGTCDVSSQVGTTTVAVGSGPAPVSIPQAGKDPTAVYLGGPYKGAPFSLVIKVPAQAGPFDLGVVVVRAAIFVDQHDAHLTVKSDPLPQILEGIPLSYQKINVLINRPGFILNPTSCDPKAITASVTSAQGAVIGVSSRFQATNCAALSFSPVFKASTSANLKFKGGASFKVHVAVPAGDANIKSLATTLPKELPSRLIPTINNACEYATFLADYTSCPMDSFVGTVSAVTPILDQPLTGPVYIVAPPGDVPRLEIVLLGQGKAAGVRVDLEGDVIVDSGGGRSKVTFGMVPDVPVTSFDLDLPAGPHSILDAPSHDLCKGPITLGLSVVGQNGKRSDSNPTISVSDCPKIAKVKVVSAKSTSTGLKLRVLAPAEGRLVVSGASLKDVARTVNRKLTYSVTVPLTAKAKKALAKKGKLRTRPTVYFKPVNAKKASTVRTKTLTVKKAKAKAKKHAAKKTKR